MANVFPDHSNYYLGAYMPGEAINPDSVNVIVGWSTRDTTVEYDPGSVIYPPIYYNNCPNCAFMAAAAPAAM